MKQHDSAEALAKRCSNRILEKVEVVHNNNPGGYHDFCKSLPCKVVGVGVHHDTIFWILDGDFSIWLRPSITSSWKEKSTNCTRIKMTMNDGLVCYDDAQGFFGRDSRIRLWSFVYLGEITVLKRSIEINSEQTCVSTLQ